MLSRAKRNGKLDPNQPLWGPKRVQDVHMIIEEHSWNIAGYLRFYGIISIRVQLDVLCIDPTHNPEAAGSNPVPATNFSQVRELSLTCFRMHRSAFRVQKGSKTASWFFCGGVWPAAITNRE